MTDVDVSHGRRARWALGTIAYASIPGGAAALAVAVATTAGVPVGRPTAALVVALAIGVVVLGGRPLTERIAGNLPAGDPDSALSDRIDRLAAEIDVPAPTVRTVEAGAPNAALYCRRPGDATLLVSERLLSADEAIRDAVLVAALSRSNRDAPLATAFLPVALAVETLVLLGLDLVRDWNEEDDGDERRLAFGEQSNRERSGLRNVAAVAGGGLLLVCTAPFWLLLTLGDRLLVADGRREADRIAATTGRAEPLADYLVDAPDVEKYRDWPPALDRLSVVSLTDGWIRPVRGTHRYELRVREARLRTGRD